MFRVAVSTLIEVSLLQHLIGKQRSFAKCAGKSFIFLRKLFPGNVRKSQLPYCLVFVGTLTYPSTLSAPSPSPNCRHDCHQHLTFCFSSTFRVCFVFPPLSSVTLFVSSAKKESGKHRNAAPNGHLLRRAIHCKKSICATS